mgnify:CR=1 FL=1
MKINTNQKLIDRNAKIGRYSGIASLLILGGGMYLSFRYSEQVWYSMAALILGFTLSQVSIYYSNRFGSSPRPDQRLNEALKGLDDRYAVYHYSSPVSHLLVGPAGIWTLVPYHQKGTITYEEGKGRWKRKGGNIYLKFFAQDSLGRPSLEIDAARENVDQYLSKIPDFEPPEVRAALVFTHPEAEVEVEEAPHPTLHALQLKKELRKQAKGEGSLPMNAVRTVQDALDSYR